MHILAEGYGTWDGSVVNARNPARRDVHILHNAKQDGTPSYMVVQIEADNPGVWRKSPVINSPYRLFERERGVSKSMRTPHD